jgi:hypothetical protein
MSIKTLGSIPKIWNSGNFFCLNTLWIYIYQVNWKKTTEAGRDHKETVLTSLHCTYYPFVTNIIININSQCYNLLHTYVFIDQWKKNTSVSANILEKGKVV